MKTCKTPYWLLLIFIASQLITSCKTSNDVVSGNLIQKRKYNKGYHVGHLARKNHDKNHEKSSKEEVAIHDKTQANSEKRPTQPATKVEDKGERLAVKNNDNHLYAEKSNEQPKSVYEEPVKQERPLAPVKTIEERLIKDLSPYSIKSPKDDINIMGLISLIMGVIAIAALFFSIAALIFAVGAIIFAIVGWDGGDAFAVVGLVLGIAVFLIYLLLFVLIAAIVL